MSSDIDSAISSRTIGGEAALAQLLAYHFEQVIGLFLAAGDIGVARHAERIGREQFHTGKQRGKIVGNHLLQGARSRANRRR